MRERGSPTRRGTIRSQAMKIGVLSDTHLRSPDPWLDRILDDLLSGSDVILHAGDIVTRAVLERLEESGVIAVCGNMDDYEVADAIPQVRIVSAGTKKIALIHGWGAKEGLEQRILDRVEHERPDIVVYGHSHVPFWGKVGGIQMFNPGSAGPSRSAGKSTVGVLEILNDHIEGTILPVNGCRVGYGN